MSIECYNIINDYGQTTAKGVIMMVEKRDGTQLLESALATEEGERAVFTEADMLNLDPRALWAAAKGLVERSDVWEQLKIKQERAIPGGRERYPQKEELPEDTDQVVGALAFVHGALGKQYPFAYTPLKKQSDWEKALYDLTNFTQAVEKAAALANQGPTGE